MPAFAHSRHHGLDAAQRAEEVGLHGAAEFRERQFLHRAVHADAGVIHQDVDAAALGQHLAHPVADRGIVVHVHGEHRDRQLLGVRDRPDLPAPPAGLRMVAKTVCPPRASVTAVARPMPVLVPVINAIATNPSSDSGGKDTPKARGVRRYNGGVMRPADALAATSRSSWPVRVFRLGDEPPDDLSATTTPEERLAMMEPLALEAFDLSDHSLPTYRREESPVSLRRLGE